MSDQQLPDQCWPGRSSRRRFCIYAAASVAGLMAGPAGWAQTSQFEEWRGIVFGTYARILLAGDSVSSHKAGKGVGDHVVRQAMDRCLSEIGYLENQFSLLDSHSALSRLNAAGILDPAPPEMIDLLNFCRIVSERSDGAFDPTVQPLWRLYADHFASSALPEPGSGQQPDHSEKSTELSDAYSGAFSGAFGPSSAAIEAAQHLVDWRRVLINGRCVRFARPGMALTLNGVVQGFAADRLAAILRGFGLDHALIDLGEPYALGPREDGLAWQIGLVDPRRPHHLFDQKVALEQGALASSGGYGYRFGHGSRWHHLFDPQTGLSSHSVLGVSVHADSAAKADAYATAFAVMPPERTRSLVAADRHLRARLIHTDGQVEHLGL